ncbi:MAG: response regulator [Kiritimatiellae bacterium]|nr:response regulator [Kiritimatiellia bacterium]
MAEQLQQEMNTRRIAENNLNRLKDNLEEEVVRKTSALREAKAAAEAAAEAKGRFLANMSHELRTPLNAIVGFNSLLNKTTLDSEQRQFIGAIDQSSQVLLDLIHNILDHAKIEAGKIELEQIAFNLEEILEGIVEIMGAMAQGKGVDLLFYYPPGMKKTFLGDPTRIRQILINLISNAIKFTHEGTVLIHVRHLQPSATSPDTVQFKIKDSGIGIPQEKQTGIFHSFVQADDSTTRKYGGTGLGLSIVHALVETMGGDITLRSKIGKGSLFTVRLPLQPANEPAPPPLPVQWKIRSVCIVDPSPKLLRVMRDMLKGYGLEILPQGTRRLTSCRLAEDALLHPPPNHPPGIVLINNAMPDGSGVKLLAKLRAEPAYAKTIFIALGSSINVRREEERYRAQFDGYLSKPLTGFKLRKILIRNASAESHVVDITEPDIKQAVSQSGRKILVAEDDSTSRIMMQAMLRKRGCEVTLVESGKEAVEAMKAHSFDLVFMDIMMPEMGGLEAASRIRKQLNVTTPIIALTAATLTAEQINESGINGCIFKPVKDRQIKTALHKWTEKSVLH